MNATRDVRQEFIERLEGTGKDAARLLWDQLNAYDVRCEYQEWYARAYEDQAITDGSRVWDDLTESLYNALAPKLQPLGFESWEDNNWRFLVAYIGGGWAMTHDEPRPHAHPLIQEEP